MSEYAWFSGNVGSERYAHKVGLKKPNPCGLHDMHGNVDEWCSNRVIRSGCWWYSPGYCRSAYRFSDNPSLRLDSLGFRVAHSQVEKVFRPCETVTNSIGMELIEIPAGIFTMGSPAGEKGRVKEREAQVSVTLTKPFGLGKYEVTQGQWKSVMDLEPWLNKSDVRISEDNAATYVRWDDATKFCKKLTDLERQAGKLKASEEYRLPTEAEWEYACRAGTTTAYPFGDELFESELGDYAWFVGNTFHAGEPYAHKVGLKKPNPWGLHDMHGNVCEWCSDRFGDERSGGVNPVGTKVYRVVRGGGWLGHPGDCRSAFRSNSSNHFQSQGFRVARSQSVK